MTKFIEHLTKKIEVALGKSSDIKLLVRMEEEDGWQSELRSYAWSKPARFWIGRICLEMLRFLQDSLERLTEISLFK